MSSPENEAERSADAGENSILVSWADGHCQIVTLNRPAVLNAWTRGMQRRLAAMIRQFEQDPNASALVITGAGDAFCAGQDLNEVKQFSQGDVADWLDGIWSLYSALLETTKPVVAALPGVAAGSGYQFALLCDMRVAHESVRIGQPEVRSGIPSITGMAITRESAGMARTRELMLTGRLMTATEALNIGLLTKLVDREQVTEESVRMAQWLATLPRMAFAATKKELNARMEVVLKEAFSRALAIDEESWGAGEPQDTARAFLSNSR